MLPVETQRMWFLRNLTVMSRTIAAFWSHCSPQLAQSNCYSSLNFTSENPFICIFNSLRGLSESVKRTEQLLPEEHTPFSHCEQPMLASTRVASLTHALGLSEPQPRMQIRAFSKDIKCFADMPAVVSKEILRKKT